MLPCDSRVSISFFGCLVLLLIVVATQSLMACLIFGVGIVLGLVYVFAVLRLVFGIVFLLCSVFGRVYCF